MKRAVRMVMDEGRKVKVVARKTGLEATEIRTAVRGKYRFGTIIRAFL